MKASITDIPNFKRKALKWASSFDTACYFDSNDFSDRYSRFDLLIAAGKKEELIANAGNAFASLEEFRNKHQGWMPGFLAYDLKNETEDLLSQNPDYLGFPDLYFFIPQHVLMVRGSEIEVFSDEDILPLIDQFDDQHTAVIPFVQLESRLKKSEYLKAVESLRQHILKGDIYEVNFCQEFFSKYADVDPLAIFEQLNQVSPTPFAGYFKFRHLYILSATPERFLAKRASKLISQPIKGTAKRVQELNADIRIQQQLQADPKEQAENVMIVDLVRNDLTRSALAGSVKVEELFGIYSFTQVHQMISTVVATLHPAISPVKAIQWSFPIGSMTGAPKLRALQLIEQYESSKRGVYSGAVGYFSPDGDFDFNVIIRTILYNAEEKYLSFQVGSAITYQSDPELEYEECLLKASAIMQILNNGTPG